MCLESRDHVPPSGSRTQWLRDQSILNYRPCLPRNQQSKGKMLLRTQLLSQSSQSRLWRQRINLRTGGHTGLESPYLQSFSLWSQFLCSSKATWILTAFKRITCLLCHVQINRKSEIVTSWRNLVTLRTVCEFHAEGLSKFSLSSQN